MTPDPLVEIKAALAGCPYCGLVGPHGMACDKSRPVRNVSRSQADWLVGEVERLRDLLGRLEWADVDEPACQACHRRMVYRVHDPDCWLAKELRP